MEIGGVLERYKNVLSGEGHTRYKSWEYCHSVFVKQRNSGLSDETVVDFLSLHLAFYLASWGMYRGSSELLQYDYHVLEGVVRCVFDSKYSKLWDYKPNGIDKNDIELIKEAYKDIEDKLSEKLERPSHILITKIMLGTFACAPAYDEMLVLGMRKIGVKPFSKKEINLEGLVEFATKVTTEASKTKYEYGDKPYPLMKHIDMYFWLTGLESFLHEKPENEHKKLRDFYKQFLK